MPELRVGAAMVDVTPEPGTHLGGAWGVLRPGKVVWERLYARAMVMEFEGRRFCIASPDLEIVTREYSDRIRRETADQCELEYDAIAVAFPQIHSVPPVGNFILGDEIGEIPAEHEYLRGSQSDYCDIAVKGIVESIIQANEQLAPVEMVWGRAVRDDLAFNRRGVTRDNSIVMPWFFSGQDMPLGPSNICYMEGPADPEIGFAGFRNASGEFVSAFLHFTCHPVNVFATEKHAISSDWPGAWCQGVQEAFGAQCIPLTLNGCCGNINPWPPFVPDFKPDHRHMGRELSKTTVRIAAQAAVGQTVPFDYRVKHLAMPLKKASEEDRCSAEEMLARNPSPVWQEDNPEHVTDDWIDAAMLLSVEMERENCPDYDCEIQVVRVGDLAIVNLPGEPFVEAQLEIKIKSPAAITMFTHCANDFAGYIAPIASYARGGHEIRKKPAKWAKVESGALEAITKSVIEMLEELYS